MKKYLLFGVIASVLSINAYAVSATVTSKDYVDTTRQATIPASGTNSATPGDTVVTYTDTAGTIGERGICNDPDEDDCNVGDLVTLGQVMNFVAEGLDDTVNNMPTITTSKMTCVDSPDCTLWSVADQTVYGACKAYSESANDAGECCSGVLSGGLCKCGTDSDCVASYGPGAFCNMGTCHADGDGK